LFDRSKNSARSWIVQVTYHRAIDRRRYLQSRHFYTQVDLEDVARELGDTGYKTAIDGLEHEGLRKLFHSLSENQRQTLRLFFFEGLTLHEIALKLGQTRGNVKNHYFRGLDKLRKQLLTAEGSAIERCDRGVVHPERRVRLADDPAGAGEIPTVIGRPRDFRVTWPLTSRHSLAEAGRDPIGQKSQSYVIRITSEGQGRSYTWVSGMVVLL
jgi:RNA polymerase sigma factor (sigma-70 family)